MKYQTRRTGDGDNLKGGKGKKKLKRGESKMLKKYYKNFPTNWMQELERKRQNIKKKGTHSFDNNDHSLHFPLSPLVAACIHLHTLLHISMVQRISHASTLSLTLR